jgi:16S rRNA (cytosine1402-N4)-methyltransferase
VKRTRQRAAATHAYQEFTVQEDDSGSPRTLAHTPVLREAVLDALAIRPDGAYLDATFGRGGHALEILARLDARGSLLVLDRDPDAIAAAQRHLGRDPRVRIAQAAFDRLGELAAPASLAGALFDLGVSSPQLDDAARGFSFLRDGPLDMRMNPDSGPSAAQFLARASAAEITDVIRSLGEERFARRIAQAVLAARATTPLARTAQLAALIASAVPSREPGKHPATRTFQALRMHINDELGQLERALPVALDRLAPEGRLAVISFHSLEDRATKLFMRREANGDPAWRGLPNPPAAARPRLALIGKALRASSDEIAHNPRARSATLRVARKLAP